MHTHTHTHTTIKKNNTKNDKIYLKIKDLGPMNDIKMSTVGQKRKIIIII
jgi:hypothetical protein